MSNRLRVVVVGAGFGGIAAAIELQRQGIADVTILERAGGLGGTWRHNTYPGAACDVPSHLYSYSFAQRTDWTRLCSPQPEILAYAEEVARRHGVDRLVVGDTEVTACRWDTTTATWTVQTAGSRSYEADAIVLATGQLHRPARPEIPGAESFTGRLMHSAEWDPDLDLRDQRVAVIGTGASAVQFVPEIARVARSLTVFQRTGNWFLPRRNRPYPRAWRAAVAHVPGLQRWRRAFVTHYGEALTAMIRHPKTLGRIGAARSALFMRAQLRDPELRRKAWPDYAFGCKRVLFSSAFLPALARDNVELVTDAITSIGPDGPVTANGRTVEVDTIIYATGFRTNDFVAPMEVTGTDGRTLHEAWSGGASAHLGITVPGFPSMFLMYGPNTNTSGGSILVYLEAQAAYLAQALALVRSRGGAALDVRPDVAARSDGEVQGRFAGTAWTACDSWYRDGGGRIVANWPGYMREYVRATAALDPSEFTVVSAPVAAQPADSLSG
ncbi:NAD(P)/FAD-dependent oxidoreductase [Baekduia sp.]|jgi:cation diffusion facilitator CzcD-associated flavoprotein CzcO|uniref:flavin-containing monooxygenase n=1 Tax=Baekduia sp. TaxID=2600305 RepID=UPI002DFB5809|nr:NAD(P)/FAD-dependent oxidoreductase [Baekduia sp.]